MKILSNNWNKQKIISWQVFFVCWEKFFLTVIIFDIKTFEIWGRAANFTDLLYQT